MDIKIFTNGGGGQGSRPEADFFLHITILFHQYNTINIIYQQFYCFLRYILYA